MRATAVLVLAACAARDPIVAERSEPLVLFSPGAIPAQTNVDMGYDVEIGVEVWPDVGGTVNGVRFYKGSADSGVHVGHLWSSGGQLLATAIFTGETASGWQEAHFLPAVPIAAGTHVVASYHTTTGFSWTEGYYATQRDAAPLHVPAGGGVYAWGPSRDPIFPNQRYHDSSYWVDVDFRPPGGCAPACSACGGDDGCGGVCCAPGRHSIWAPSDGPTTPGYSGPEPFELGTHFAVSAPGRVRALRYYKDAAAVAATTGHLWDESRNLLATVAISPGAASGWQEAPLATPLFLVPGRTYVVSVAVAHGFAYTTHYFDDVGHGAPPVVAPVGAGVFGAPGSFPTQSWAGSSYWVDVVFDPDATELSLFPPWLSPAEPQYAVSTPFELGVKFTTAVAGTLTHLRFYKGAGNDGPHVGHLWDANGTLLATAPFTGETASGWQQIALASPVALTPGAPYVASVSTRSGFAWTMQFFATPYHAAPFEVQTAGGVFASPSGFPTQSYQNSSYWVDFAFQPRASSCVPVCIGRLCGDPDTCGGTCLSGGGCTVALDPGVPFWWDHWPRVTNNQNVDGAAATNATLATGALLADEGRGPFFRFHEALIGRDNFIAMQQAGVHALAWVPGQGTSSVILAALHQLPDGSYEADPATGGPRIVATDWSWEVNGLGRDPDANAPIWLGLQSFVNDEPWLGPYTHIAYDPALPLPTYPDGTPALGSIGDPSDPRNARLYDGLGTKDLNGNPGPECATFDEHPNPNGRLTAIINGVPTPTGYCYMGKDTAAPFWLDYVRDAARFLMRWGVDAIWLDNTSGWHSYFHGNPLTVAFGDWSVATFRRFLASHPTAGVSDPSTFDVRAYLKAQLASWYPAADPSNLADPGWKDARWLDDPVWRAYRVHKSQVAHAFASSLRAIVKDEAASAGRDPDAVAIGGNDIPAISLGAITGEEVDMVNTEYTPDWARDTGAVGRGLPPYGHAGPFYATAVRYGQSRHAIVWYYVKEEYLGHPVLGEVVGFEALASNCMIYGGSFDKRIVGTDASTKKVNDTIARMAPVFGGRQRAGAVAILYSTETQQTFLAPGDFVGFDATTSDPAHPGYLDHSLGHAGWGAALEELHVPYRSIPDFRLSLAELTGVSIVILPHVRAIEASTVENVLVPFLRAGGGIIMTGSSSGSLHTQAGLYAPNPSPLLDGLRTRDVRPGYVLFVEGNPGFEFHMGQLDPAGARRVGGRTAIATALYNLRTILGLQEQIVTTAGPRIVTALHGDGLANRFFVDFVNLDIDPATDTLTPAPGSSLTWTVPAALVGRPLRVTAYDADGAGGVPLAVTTSGDGRVITVSVPGFRVYQSLVLEGN